MYYKFDSISGRVLPSTTSRVYNAAGLTPATTEGPKQPVFMFESSKVKAVSSDIAGDALSRQSTATGKALGTFPSDAGYGKIVALQKKWSVEDGLLVWQKRGFRDSGPYYVTLAGIAIGVGYSVYLIYKMSFPKKLE